MRAQAIAVVPPGISILTVLMALRGGLMLLPLRSRLGKFKIGEEPATSTTGTPLLVKMAQPGALGASLHEPVPVMSVHFVLDFPEMATGMQTLTGRSSTDLASASICRDTWPAYPEALLTTCGRANCPYSGPVGHPSMVS